MYRHSDFRRRRSGHECSHPRRDARRHCPWLPRDGHLPGLRGSDQRRDCGVLDGEREQHHPARRHHSEDCPQQGVHDAGGKAEGVQQHAGARHRRPGGDWRQRLADGRTHLRPGVRRHLHRSARHHRQRPERHRLHHRLRHNAEHHHGVRGQNPRHCHEPRAHLLRGGDGSRCRFPCPEQRHRRGCRGCHHSRGLHGCRPAGAVRGPRHPQEQELEHRHREREPQVRRHVLRRASAQGAS